MPFIASTVDKEHDLWHPSNNPCSRISSGATECSQEDFLAVLDFLRRAAALPSCVIQAEGTTKFHPTTCTCLHELHPVEGEQGPSEKLRMVAAVVCNYSLLNNKVRRRLEIQHAEEASSWAEHFNGNNGKPYYISLATTAPYEDLAPDLDKLAAVKC